MENSSPSVQLRDYQKIIVERAVEAFKSGKNIILNAPTGTGKTLMALSILKSLEKIGWIYVRTISQYSAWERDSKKLGLSFSGLMRKGEFCKALKKPYILYCSYCGEEVDEKDESHLKRHKKFIERKYVSPKCYDPFAIGWGRYCHYRPEYITRAMLENDEDAVEFISLVNEKMEKLLAEGGIKTTANWFRDNKVTFKNTDYDICVYKLIEGNTQVRIYSYIYYFLGLRKPEENDANSVLVFDESHNLDDFNINSVTLSKKEVLSIFDRITVGDISKEKLMKEVEEDFQNFIEDPDRGFNHLSILSQVSEETARKFNVIMRAWSERDTWYVERSQQEGYIKVMPADPAVWLSKLNNYRYILLSGTMPSKEYLKSVWGLNNFEYIDAMSLVNSTSLKHHFKGAEFYVDDSIYYIKENRASLRKQVAETIKKYAVKDGLNLVVLPSYDELEAYRSLFIGAFFEDIRPDVLDRARKLPNGSLVFSVAGGKLSEGVEVLDAEGKSRIKTVFIVGLPLPEYKNPFLEKQVEVVAKRINRDPKAFKWVILYEKATIKVRQAIGRAIRGPQDTAKIYLFDKRYTYKSVVERMNLEVVQ